MCLTAPPAAPDTARRGGGECPIWTNNYVQLRAPRVAPLHSADSRFIGRKGTAGAGGGPLPRCVRTCWLTYFARAALIATATLGSVLYLLLTCITFGKSILLNFVF